MKHIGRERDYRRKLWIRVGKGDLESENRWAIRACWFSTQWSADARVLSQVLVLTFTNEKNASPDCRVTGSKTDKDAFRTSLLQPSTDLPVSPDLVERA